MHGQSETGGRQPSRFETLRISQNDRLKGDCFGKT
jgi:hypothetical protein